MQCKECKNYPVKDVASGIHLFEVRAHFYIYRQCARLGKKTNDLRKYLATNI